MQFLLADICDGNFASGALAIDEGPRKPKLVATYNTLIDLYGKAGRLKDALDMFLDMPAHGVMPDKNITKFGSVMVICMLRLCVDVNF